MGATTAEGDLATVQRFMGLIGEGNFEEARPLMHEDFVCDEAGGLPYSGEYHGPDGFFGLAGTILEQVELIPEQVEILQIDDTYVGRFRLTFKRRSNGESVSMKFIEIYTMRDGKIAALDVYYKDPLAVTRLLSE